MRPTSTAALLAAATLAGAASINIPRTTTVDRTAGCGTTYWFNGIPQYHSLQSGTRSCDYSIHLPSLYGAEWEQKIPVYPNGVGGAWAAANYSEAIVSEHLKFVSDLLDEICAGCLPSAAAFHTVASAPGGGNFAPFAAGSGSFYIDNGGVSSLTDVPTNLFTPLPVLEIHGGSDTDVPYAGGAGEGGTEPAIVCRWATRNGCTGGNTTETFFSGDLHHTSRGCAGAGVEGESVLQHWKVDMPSTSLDFSEIATGQEPIPIDASTIVKP
ncbi:carbohydrate esterase family 1 protein [Mycena albidolilacea]|uniref:Carbohydrate esterase family 1 protein n=1 Tax=Mycena albidolilacea TaxID=1033008 RepID=A0AAD6ZLR1_9AGAR|nr:carbohydrate esterase family 1 protein [Mycena albidolilacea]